MNLESGDLGLDISPEAYFRSPRPKSKTCAEMIDESNSMALHRS